MAKLSVKGRTELSRMVKETNISTLDSQLISWERKTFVLMSDRMILEKRDVQFRPTSYDPKGSKHSYGWKKLARLKADVTTERFEEINTKHGYVRG